MDEAALGSRRLQIAEGLSDTCKELLGSCAASPPAGSPCPPPPPCSRPPCPHQPCPNPPNSACSACIRNHANARGVRCEVDDSQNANAQCSRDCATKSCTDTTGWRDAAAILDAKTGCSGCQPHAGCFPGAAGFPTDSDLSSAKCEPECSINACSDDAKWGLCTTTPVVGCQGQPMATCEADFRSGLCTWDTQTGTCSTTDKPACGAVTTNQFGVGQQAACEDAHDIDGSGAVVYPLDSSTRPSKNAVQAGNCTWMPPIDDFVDKCSGCAPDFGCFPGAVGYPQTVDWFCSLGIEARRSVFAAPGTASATSLGVNLSLLVAAIAFVATEQRTVICT